MKFQHCLFVFAIALLTMVGSDQAATAQGPGWYPFVIARGQDREKIQKSPIELRPYRPLHFYGNTVRRNYYRTAGNSNQTRVARNRDQRRR